MNEGDLIIGALLYFLSRGGKAGTSKTTPAKAADAIVAISSLQQRAQQQQAQDWQDELEAAGASADKARALTRWIGIESSGYGAGDPRATSPLGEKGLLQIMPATAKEALTPGEFLELGDPATTRAEQARIAMKQYAWHVEKAKKWVKDWPGDATFDAVWYAKLHHQRPKDLSDAKLSGGASKNAHELAVRWKNDAAALKRLAAANVVAWGTTEAP